MISDDEIKKFKNEKGEESFYTTADDAMWYFSESNDFLKANNFKVESTEAKKILFIKQNGQNVEIDRDKENIGYWQYILFNGIDNPVAAYPIDLKTKFKDYIEK